MFPIGSRVKCASTFYATTLYGKIGTVVASHADRRKVLFDKDRVFGDLYSGQNLASAYWFYIHELQDES